MLSPEAEFAWAAGLFEGEGSIVARRVHRPGRNGATGQRLQLTTTDEDVVRRFAAAVGCGKICGPYSGRRSAAGTPIKPVYLWQLYNATACLELLDRLEPLLGERRRGQALALRESVAVITHWHKPKEAITC